ncbi:hypothetical protein VTH82DRAFT_5449 [Thermothelomyces myriococcoides]
MMEPSSRYDETAPIVAVEQMPTEMEDVDTTTINPADWEYDLGYYPSVVTLEPGPAVADTVGETDLLKEYEMVLINGPAVVEELTANRLGDGSGDVRGLLQGEEGVAVPSIDVFNAFTEPSQQEPASIPCSQIIEELDMTEAYIDELGRDMAACYLDSDLIASMENAKVGHLNIAPLHMFQTMSQEPMHHYLCSSQDPQDHGGNSSPINGQNVTALSRQLQPEDGWFIFPDFNLSNTAHGFQPDQSDWVQQCDSSQCWRMANRQLLPLTDEGAFRGIDVEFPQHTSSWANSYHQFPFQAFSPHPPVVIQNSISVGTINISPRPREQNSPS